MPPTPEENTSMTAVWSAAEVAIRTLRSIGLTDVCFVGGVACALYGNTRNPNVRSLLCPFGLIVSSFSCELVQDLDILILNAPYGQETIKRMLTSANPAFYTVASKTIGATYRVLWYNPRGSSLFLRTDSVKVDILLPGIMDIPSFSADYISTNNSRQLPAAPFSIVLLLKLQAWSQHRAAFKAYLNSKQYTDASDLEIIVPLAAANGVRISEAVLPSSFVEAAKHRVLEYVRNYPSSRTISKRRTIGFTLPHAQHSSRHRPVPTTQYSFSRR